MRREVTGAPRSVTLDRHKLIQVLYNLLSNAVKFTNEEGHAALLIDRPSAAELRITASLHRAGCWLYSRVPVSGNEIH